MTFANKLKQLHESATPGPWTYIENKRDMSSEIEPILREHMGFYTGNMSFSDMELICLFRNHTKQLLELLRAVEYVYNHGGTLSSVFYALENLNYDSDKGKS